jgi:hypothetical protein
MKQIILVATLAIVAMAAQAQSGTGSNPNRSPTDSNHNSLQVAKQAGLNAGRLSWRYGPCQGIPCIAPDKYECRVGSTEPPAGNRCRYIPNILARLV